MAELRSNRVKRKLANGGTAMVVSGLMTPDIVDFLGPLGFDGFWFEGEHGPVDYNHIPDLARACDLWGVTSIVRVNQNVPGIIYRTLDLGAQGICVPHINTAAEAGAVVDAAKFHPIGHRGISGGRWAYGVTDAIAKANDETLVMILIEDIVAVNNLDEILAVDHVDVYFVAPGDLGQSMGYLGAPNAEVQATIDGAIRKIAAAGKVAGALVTDANVERYAGLGARFLFCGWGPWVTAGARAYMDKVASLKA